MFVKIKNFRHFEALTEHQFLEQFYNSSKKIFVLIESSFLLQAF